MSKKIAWDKFEVALLIEAFWKIKNNEGNRYEVLESLSISLRQMAVNRGVDIDDNYRNFNGVSFQVNIIEQLFFLKDSSMHYATIFKDLVAVYENNREEFNVILAEAKRLVNDSTETDVFRFKCEKQLPLKEKDKLVYSSINKKRSINPVDISIDALGLSVRGLNVLMRLEVKNLEDLLRMDESVLLHAPNCGVKTLNEIIALQKKYRESGTNLIDWAKCNENTKNSIIKHIRYCLGLTTEDISQSNSYWSNFSGFDKSLNDSIDTLGREMCLCIIKNIHKDYLKSLLCTLEYASEEAENEILNNIFLSFFNNIDTRVLFVKTNCCIDLYIKSYPTIKNETIDSLVEFCKNYETILDMKEMRISSQEELDLICPFLEWLQFDIDEIAVKMLNACLKKDKVLFVLDLRSRGFTLEAIGQLLEVTRERVRQIENVAFKELKLIYKHFNLLSYLCLLHKTDEIITDDVFLQELAFEGKDILLYLLKNSNLEEYDYNTHTQSFCLSSIARKNSGFILEEILKLPSVILKTEFDSIVLSISEKYNVELEFVKNLAISEFKEYGKYYSKGNLTITQMCEIVLEKYYPTGVKLYGNATDLFRQRMIDEFGIVKDNLSNRAIEARVASFAVLCNRGSYIHKSRIIIDQDTLDKIIQYIETSRRKAFAYSEIFEKYLDELKLKTSITNRFYLQGVLRLFLQSKYYFYKDYFAKISDYSLDQEIENYIEQEGEVNFYQLLEIFKGVSNAALFQTLIRLPKVIGIDGGNYIHVSSLNILEDDYNIKYIISKNINERSPISSKKLLDILYISHSDFLARNNIDNHSKLFGVLSYMFKDEFGFSRPFIGIKNLKDISRRDVIISLFEGMEKLSLDDARYLCDEQRIDYGSYNSLCYLIEDYYLRINQYELVSCDKLDLSEGKVNKILNCVDRILETRKWVSLSSITNFLSFPDIGVQWTNFLLRGILHKYSTKHRLIDIYTTQYYVMNTICIGEELQISTYEELVHHAALEEQKIRKFENLSDFSTWLKQEGLILSELSSIILNYKWLVIDEIGSIYIEE